MAFSFPSSIATFFLSKPSVSRKFSCKAKEFDNMEISQTSRRDFLALSTLCSFAIYPSAANPTVSPDYLNCGDTTKPDGTPVPCCPPTPPEITDYFIPSATCTVRVRAAAQAADGAKFARAVELMKQLPSDDPRCFTQQANIHCVYCSGGYNQKGFSDPGFEFAVHGSWLFFPFHRWYLYFFEKICAKLLQDDTFALPFWNWDSPCGMQIPGMFNITTSALHDTLRNGAHLPPAVIDLNWNYADAGTDPVDQIRYNLSLMYRNMVTNATTPRLFMGRPFRGGHILLQSVASGSLEIAPHNTVHAWTGDSNQLNRENMGTFYSAARDPIFYAHHANIDRLWSTWVSKLGGKFFSDPDWLDSSFMFYDEDAKPRLVRVKDCLDMTTLGYTYEEVELPWLDFKPIPRRKGVPVTGAPEVSLSQPLDRALTIVVKRPERSKSEEEAEEVVVIEDMEYNICTEVKFDVLVNEDDVDSCTPENSEFLGSFVNVPHRHPKMVKGSCTFAISSILKDLEIDESDEVLVTLVPRFGRVSIGGLTISSDMSKS